METIVNKNEYPRQDYYFGMMEDVRNIFIGFGKYLFRHEISGQGTLEDYVEYLNKREIELKEQQLQDFFSKLEIGDYKVILYNGQTPLVKDDDISEAIMELIISNLDEKSIVGLDSDIIVIHNENETIELKGYINMSDSEIFARQYLDECIYGDLIVKDSLEQVEFHDRNFKNTEEYYSKCKNIINIRTVPNDSEHYKMNWDCIIIKYINSDKEEIWQRS